MNILNKKSSDKSSIFPLGLWLTGAVFFVSSLIELPTKVFADSTALSSAINLKDPLKSTTNLQGFLANILGGVVLILTPVVVIMVVYCGFLFVSAQGNSEKLKDAKKALMYTLLGAAIVIGAKGLETIVQNTVGALAS